MIRINIQILGLVLLAGFLCAADVVAQGGGRGRGGGGFGGTRLLDLLSNETVQKELEMSDDQVAEVEALEEESRERRSEAMQEVRESFRNGDREEAMEKAREVFGELVKEDEADIEDVLIGEQFDRLKQISIQRDLAGRNAGSAMEKLLEQVDATDDEIEKFEEVKERLEKEAAAKIAKIRSQTLEQIARQSLSTDKADKFMDIIGKAIEGGAANLQNRGRGGRGGDDGGRGGRGGRGGFDGGGKGGGKGGGREGRRPEGDEF